MDECKKRINVRWFVRYVRIGKSVSKSSKDLSAVLSTLDKYLIDESNHGYS